MWRKRTEPYANAAMLPGKLREHIGRDVLLQTCFLQPSFSTESKIYLFSVQKSSWGNNWVIGLGSECSCGIWFGFQASPILQTSLRYQWCSIQDQLVSSYEQQLIYQVDNHLIKGHEISFNMLIQSTSVVWQFWAPSSSRIFLTGNDYPVSKDGLFKLFSFIY